MTAHPIFENATTDAFYNQYLLEKTFDALKGVSHVRGAIDRRSPGVAFLDAIKPDLLERRPLEAKVFRGVAPLFDYAQFSFDNLLGTFNSFAGRFPVVADPARATMLARQNVPIVKTDRLRLNWTSPGAETHFFDTLSETPAARRKAYLKRHVRAFRSICVDGVPGVMTSFFDQVESLYDTSALPVVFSASEGKRVIDCHYDFDPTLIIQTEGTKEWVLYEPVVRHATQTAYIPTVPELKATAAKTVTLTPGDVMILPRGFAHETRALSKSSTHLAIVFKVPSEVEVLNYLLNKRLHRLAQDARLRKIPRHFRDSTLLLSFTKNQKLDAALDLSNVQRVYMYPSVEPPHRGLPHEVSVNDAIRIHRRPFAVVTYSGYTKILFDGKMQVVPGEFAALGSSMVAGSTIKVRDLFATLGKAPLSQKRALLGTLNALGIASHAP